MSTSRWKCKECEHICTHEQILYADNPFNSDEVICGCPQCKSVEAMERVCDVEGCERLVSCGWPGEDGEYHHTCGEHDRSFQKDVAVSTYDFSAFDLAAKVLLESGNLDC